MKTLEQVKEMQDGERMICTASLCGISAAAMNARLDWERALTQQQHGEIGVDEFYKRHLRVDPTPEPIPDYLHSLDAMHAAVETMNEQQKADYADALWHLIPMIEGGTTEDGEPELCADLFGYCEASARDRNAAFLSVMLP